MGEMNQSIASEFNYVYDAAKYSKTPLEARIDLHDTDKALNEKDNQEMITPQCNYEPSKML